MLKRLYGKLPLMFRFKLQGKVLMLKLNWVSLRWNIEDFIFTKKMKLWMWWKFR